MDNQITKLYFKGALSIPNIGIDTADDFDDTWINNYQNEYLLKVLGYSLFKDYETGLAITPTIPQKWLDLKNGVDYNVTINGNEVKTRWNGFSNDEKISPIANYVYYHWLAKNYAKLQENGVSIAVKENATNYTNIFKNVDAWNGYIRLTGNIRKYVNRNDFKIFTEENNKLYFSTGDLNFKNETVQLDNSLFMFLYNHRGDYPGWIFENNISQNVFSL